MELTDSNPKIKAIEHAKSLYGYGFDYELKKGTCVTLSDLKDNQYVCASGIKGYHILMTKKS